MMERRRLPGWDGGRWTTPEPWRFLIDLAYKHRRFGNWFEEWLRTNFDIGQVRR